MKFVELLYMYVGSRMLKFKYSFLCDGSVDLVGRALDLHAKIGVRILAPKDQLLKRVVNDSLPNECVFDTLKNV